MGTEPDRRDGLFPRRPGRPPYDTQVAATWGQLQAYAQLRGRPRPQNDTWIAACCLARDLPLASFNVKDFNDFADHEGLSLIT
ncbi:MAG: hypothetical protein WAL50_15505 [Kineosporiaceae bacterium]